MHANAVDTLLQGPLNAAHGTISTDLPPAKVSSLSQEKQVRIAHRVALVPRTTSNASSPSLNLAAGTGGRRRAPRLAFQRIELLPRQSGKTASDTNHSLQSRGRHEP